MDMDKSYKDVKGHAQWNYKICWEIKNYQINGEILLVPGLKDSNIVKILNFANLIYRSTQPQFLFSPRNWHE